MGDILSIAHRHGADDRALSDETAEMLRKWLKMAEDGEIVSVAMVGEKVNGDPVIGRSIAARRFPVIGGLQFLISELIDIHKEG